jgi:hypothetical protein
LTQHALLVHRLRAEAAQALAKRRDVQRRHGHPFLMRAA